MNKKSHLTKIISITIALIVLLAGLSIGVTANAATMKYNIDNERCFQGDARQHR